MDCRYLIAPTAGVLASGACCFFFSTTVVSSCLASGALHVVALATLETAFITWIIHQATAELFEATLLHLEPGTWPAQDGEPRKLAPGGGGWVPVSRK